MGARASVPNQLIGHPASRSRFSVNPASCPLSVSPVTCIVWEFSWRSVLCARARAALCGEYSCKRRFRCKYRPPACTLYPWLYARLRAGSYARKRRTVLTRTGMRTGYPCGYRAVRESEDAELFNASSPRNTITETDTPASAHRACATSGSWSSEVRTHARSRAPGGRGEPGYCVGKTAPRGGENHTSRDSRPR